MMSGKVVPLTRERSERNGSCPNNVAGSQRLPRAGAAESNRPHQNASTGTWFCNPPKVRNAVLAPCVFTLTPVGFTRICAGRLSGASRKSSEIALRMMRVLLEQAEVDTGDDRPGRARLRCRCNCDRLEWIELGRLAGKADEHLAAFGRLRIAQQVEAMRELEPALGLVVFGGRRFIFRV